MALGIQGSAPPTASSRRGTSSAKRETEASVLEELSGKLNSKMRQKFSAVAGDLKAQEIIATEVSGFLQSGRKISVAALNSLEKAIKLSLTGEKPAKAVKSGRVKSMTDEWSEIMKKDQELYLEQEKKLKEKQFKTTLQMKKDLERQMQEKEKIQAQMKKDDYKYYAEDQKAVEQWKLEEEKKEVIRKQKMLEIKKQRAQQIDDRQTRKVQEINKKKLEEDELKKRIEIETIKEMEKEESIKKKMKDDMEQLLKHNEKNKVMRAEAKKVEEEIELKYQNDYIKLLEQQEKKRAQALLDLKAKQDRQEAIGREIGEYKRWVDPKIIEDNFKRNEAAEAKKEAEKEKKRISMNYEVKRILQEQIKEKNKAKEKEAEIERKHIEQFKQETQEYETEQERKRKEKLMKKIQHKEALEAQMRENAKRREVRSAMSHIEKSLNRKKLEQLNLN